MNPVPQGSTPRQKPAYRWPWFVLGAFVLAVILAVVWMSYEVKRTRMIREFNSSSTNMIP